MRRAGEEANLALKELRDLARGIHPAILTNRGLPAALDDLAGRAAVPVEVVATPDERLPGAVEAAVYFVVSECLANMGKHAAASSATVAVSVRDDPRGRARVGRRRGRGGHKQRLGAPGSGRPRGSARRPRVGAEPVRRRHARGGLDPAGRGHARRAPRRSPRPSR